MIEIMIGAITGIVFGIVQVWVLSRTVLSLTREEEHKTGAFVWVILQFPVTIAAFVALGFYSTKSLISAGIGMATASIIVWLIQSKKTTGKGN